MGDTKNKEELDIVPAGSQEIANSKDSTGDKQAQAKDEGTQDSKSKGSEDTKSAEQDTSSKKDAEAKTDSKDTGKDTQGDIESVLKKYADTQEQITSQLSSLNERMGQGQQQEQGQQEQAKPDYQSELSALDEKLSDGEITLAEHTQKSRSIMQQQLTEEIASQFEEKMSERQAEEARQRFLEQNPDFEQISQSQEFQNFLQENPVYDVAGAYEHFKRQQDQQQIQSLQQQLDQLKQQQEAAVKNGAKVTDSVGKTEGSEMRQGMQAANENLSAEQGMLAALRQFRAQSGSA